MERVDFRFQLGNRSGGGCLVYQLFFEIFLLLRVEVVIVFGNTLQSFGKRLSSAYAELLFA